MKNEEIKKVVRENYGNIATQDTGCGCGCGPEMEIAGSNQADNISKTIGYSDDELKNLPEGANLGLGCGNPVALAELKEGDTFLDLGSGAGIDCFFAAKKVGKTGKVIGVDMTAEMIDKARENAKNSNFENVEFRLGEIEHLPVANGTVDLITSNCVINLVPDKSAVFEEAFRVLKPGGKLMISDIVLEKPLPKGLLDSVEAYIGCVSGAILKDEYVQKIKDAGFKDTEIKTETRVPIDAWMNDTTIKFALEKLNITETEIREFGDSIVSISYTATKPE